MTCVDRLALFELEINRARSAVGGEALRGLALGMSGEWMVSGGRLVGLEMDA